jgi:hypothetical protein
MLSPRLPLSFLIYLLLGIWAILASKKRIAALRFSRKAAVPFGLLTSIVYAI